MKSGSKIRSIQKSVWNWRCRFVILLQIRWWKRLQDRQRWSAVLWYIAVRRRTFSVESLDDLYLDPEGHTELTAQQIEGRTVTAIELDGYCVNREGYNRNALYQTLRQTGMEK